MVLGFTARLGLLLWIPSVLASVYPTQPVAKTCFFSGKPEIVIWKDDLESPHLEDIPPMKIDLYNGSNRITTLARHVHAVEQSHTISIPPNLTTGSTYALVFKIPEHDPPLIIWTADFTISSESQDLVFPDVPQAVLNTSFTNPNVTFNASASSISAPMPVSTGLHPNPIGAQPGSPYRDGGSSSKKNGAITKLDLKTPTRLRVFAISVLGFVTTMVVGLY